MTKNVKNQTKSLNLFVLAWTRFYMGENSFIPFDEILAQWFGGVGNNIRLGGRLPVASWCFWKFPLGWEEWREYHYEFPSQSSLPTTIFQELC